MAERYEDCDEDIKHTASVVANAFIIMSTNGPMDRELMVGMIAAALDRERQRHRIEKKETLND